MLKFKMKYFIIQYDLDKIKGLKWCVEPEYAEIIVFNFVFGLHCWGV